MLITALLLSVAVGMASAIYYWFERYRRSCEIVDDQKQAIADLRKHAANADEVRRACQESEKAAWESVKHLEDENRQHEFTIEILRAKVNDAKRQAQEVIETLT